MAWPLHTRPLGGWGGCASWAPAVWREVSAAGGGLSVAWRLLHKQQ